MPVLNFETIKFSSKNKHYNESFGLWSLNLQIQYRNLENEGKREDGRQSFWPDRKKTNFPLFTTNFWKMLNLP